ncbi:MAG: hypothetical protein AAF515_04995 [Pseudomonadota bacterium]
MSNASSHARGSMDSLLSLWRCPQCGRDTPSREDRDPQCRRCGLRWPTFGTLRCALPDPRRDLPDWRARAHHSLQALRERARRATHAQTTLQQPSAAARGRVLDTRNPAAPSASTPAATATRLERLAAGLHAQLDCQAKVLAPLLGDTPSSDLATYRGLGAAQLEADGQLYDYAANLFRDWAWGELENRVSLTQVAAALPVRVERCIMLGAGAGRLAYDLAVARPDTTFIALEWNPLAALVGARLSAGDALTLWETPLAPRSVDDVIIEQQLRAPAGAADNLSWLWGDARQVPLIDGCADLVITPWLTDVIAGGPIPLIREVNRLLCRDGHWLNFGSLCFADAHAGDPGLALLLPELIELAAGLGFDAQSPRVSEFEAPYLDSPHSRFARRELLHVLRMTKRSAAVSGSAAGQGRVKRRPAERKPVALTPTIEGHALSSQVQAYVLSLIDGRRSIIDIAAELEARRLLSREEAIPLISSFLEKLSN